MLLFHKDRYPCLNQSVSWIYTLVNYHILAEFPQNILFLFFFDLLYSLAIPDEVI